MAVAYKIIQRQVALRVNAIVGVTAAQMEAAYITSPLTSSVMTSPIFPFSSLNDAVLAAEGRFVHAIANSSHPYRRYLRGISAAQSNETAMPTATVTSQPVVGIPGVIYDSSDGTPCTPRPLPEIIRRTRNAGSFFRGEAYHYNITGETLYHTRNQVVVEVCTYNEAGQRAALAANGDILLPDEMVEAYIDEALRILFRDDEFAAQGAQFGAIADQWFETFKTAGRQAA